MNETHIVSETKTPALAKTCGINPTIIECVCNKIIQYHITYMSHYFLLTYSRITIFIFLALTRKLYG